MAHKILSLIFGNIDIETIIKENYNDNLFHIKSSLCLIGLTWAALKISVYCKGPKNANVRFYKCSQCQDIPSHGIWKNNEAIIPSLE